MATYAASKRSDSKIRIVPAYIKQAAVDQIFFSATIYATYLLTAPVFGFLVGGVISIIAFLLNLFNSFRTLKGKTPIFIIKSPVERSANRLIFIIATVAAVHTVAVLEDILRRGPPSITYLSRSIPDIGKYSSDDYKLQCGDWGALANISARAYEATQTFPEGWKFSLVATGSNSRSGFYSEAYFDVGDTLVVAFRGTSNFRNVLSDVLMGFGHLPAIFDDGDVFLRSVRGHFPDRTLVLTGHSLGGSIAQYLAAKYGLRAATYNAFGVKHIATAEIRAKVPEAINERVIFNFRHRYDMVSIIEFPFTFFGLSQSLLEFASDKYSRHMGCTLSFPSFGNPFNVLRWHSIDTIRNDLLIYEFSARPSDFFCTCRNDKAPLYYFIKRVFN
jgi:hypothetical protein